MVISLTTFLIDRFNNVATEATVIKRFVELIDWHYFILQFGKVFKEHFSKNGVLCTTNSRVFWLWVFDFANPKKLKLYNFQIWKKNKTKRKKIQCIFISLLYSKSKPNSFKTEFRKSHQAMEKRKKSHFCVKMAYFGCF